MTHSVEKCIFSSKKIGGTKRYLWNIRREAVLDIRSGRFQSSVTLYKFCGLGQVTTMVLRSGLFILQAATWSWPWLPGRLQCRSIKQCVGWFMGCIMLSTVKDNVHNRDNFNWTKQSTSHLSSGPFDNARVLQPSWLKPMYSGATGKTKSTRIIYACCWQLPEIETENS